MRKREKYTQRQVRNFLARLGARLRVNADDYTLVVGEDTYFSDSLEDIVGTAGVMLGSHPDFEDAMDSELGEVTPRLAAQRRQDVRRAGWGVDGIPSEDEVEHHRALYREFLRERTEI